MNKMIVVIMGLLSLLIPAAAISHSVYDDFSEDTIAIDKWQYPEVGKHIANGQLYMELRAFDQQFLSNALSFTNPETVDGISAVFDLSKTDHINHSPGDFLLAGFEGSFLACDHTDCNADVVAGFYVLHEVPGSSTAKVIYLIWLSNGSGWTEYATGTLAEAVDIDSPITLTVETDSNERIRFTYAGQVSGTPSTGNYEFSEITSDGTINSHFKRIVAAVGRDGSGGASGHIITSIDDVLVATNSSSTYATLNPYDNFDASDMFDSSKWIEGSKDLTGFCRRDIDSGKLLLEAEHDGTATSGVFAVDARLPSDQYTDYLQGDITIDSSTSVSGSNASTDRSEMRLEAFYFNDTYDGSTGNEYNGEEGVIASSVRIRSFNDGSNIAVAAIFRCNNSDCSTYTTIFYDSLNCNIIPNQSNTLSIKKKGKTYIFRCDDSETQWTFSRNMYDNSYDLRRFRLRTYASDGETTYGKVYVDNVYTQSGFPWGMYFPAIQYPATH